MTKKHYWTVAVCALLMVISIALYAYYYKEYIKPRNYTIGTIEKYDYKKLAIKEYLSDDTVLFSQNLDDITFTNQGQTATYEFYASPVEFNGEENDYCIFVNEHMLYIADGDLQAGSITSTYTLKYYDVDKTVLLTSNIKISFVSYSKYLVFRVTLPKSDTGLLLRYFEVNKFVVTLALNPYVEASGESETPSTSQYTVNFIVDDAIISSQMVEFCDYATPEEPAEGYGWSVDGKSIVDVSTYSIMQNTNFIQIELPAEARTITFKYSSGTVTATTGWTFADGVGTKQVVSGMQIGTLPAYSPGGLLCVNYWFYINDNGEQVVITSASIMPDRDIEICCDLKTSSGVIST